MDDAQQRLLRQLDQATSREPDADDQPLDAETARLREGWLALSRLLAAEEAEVDDQTIAARIHRAERRRMARRVVAGALAVAVSLLVVASATWFLSNRGPPDTRSLPQQLAAPKQQPSRSAATDEPTDDIEIAWDDSLDDQFAQLSRKIAGYDNQSYLDDLSFEVLDAQLQRIGQDMNEL